MTMGEGTRLHSRAAAVVGVVVVVLLVTGGVAHAADYGNWDGNRCGDRGEACLWNGNRGSGRMTSSSTRDSNFNGDYFGGGTTLELNDRVKTFENRFTTTMKLRAYHDANYVTPSSCIGAGVAIGPYVNNGSDAGLSSFKSC